MGYFGTIYQAIKTICIGMKVTLPYSSARTVVVQYPDVKPVVQKRFKGFHIIELERCIACELCAKACPVGCISIEKSGPRRYDKTRKVATGGAVTKYKIDYSMCLFCGLCTEGCPTDCIAMGNIHDSSCHGRDQMVGDFIQLAKQGRRTIEPIWLKKEHRPKWTQDVDSAWKEQIDENTRQLMAGVSDPEFCKGLAQAGKEKQGE